MEKQPLLIPGFTSDFDVRDQPSLLAFGPAGSGKTRLACTLAECGPIGFIPLDKKTRRTAVMMRDDLGLEIFLPTESYTDDRDILELTFMPEVAETTGDKDKDRKATELLQESKRQKAMGIYRKAYQRILKDAAALCRHPKVQGIVVDKANQLMDILLFANFGKNEQVMARDRGRVRADLKEFIDICQVKRLLLVADPKEIYVVKKDASGNIEIDSYTGEPKRVGTGKFEAGGMKEIYSLVTATVELSVADGVSMPKEGSAKYDEQMELALQKKFRARMYKCQTKHEYEGVDLGAYNICGKKISWDGIMTLIGIDSGVVAV